MWPDIESAKLTKWLNFFCREFILIPIKNYTYIIIHVLLNPSVFPYNVAYILTFGEHWTHSYKGIVFVLPNQTSFSGT